MGKTFRQPGEVMDFVNVTGATIPADQMLVIGTKVGITEVSIAPNTTGSVRVWGVANYAKHAGDTPAQGAALYFDHTNNVLTTTAAGNTLAGYAFLPAQAGDAVVAVKLNG